jgi:phosphonopyruvate decarboxylase
MDTLDAMDIPAYVLSDNIKTASEQTLHAIQEATEKKSPVVLAVRKNTFSKYEIDKKKIDILLSREEAIIEVTKNLEDNDLIVCTTGMPSRELFEYRANSNQGHHRDFLTVGGMGHASQIALGIAKMQKNLNIYCYDGDGAALMHMGSMPIVGQSRATNFIHILFNNGVHDSVGGQPTVGFKIDFCAIAKASGYSSVAQAKSVNEIKNILSSIQLNSGPHFIEIIVRPGNRVDIGRPTSSPLQNKVAMMNHIKNKTL